VAPGILAEVAATHRSLRRAQRDAETAPLAICRIALLWTKTHGNDMAG
jgi:hypothetical protein